MQLAVLGASVVLLLILIARFRVNAFLALLLTSFVAGVANGMPPDAALRSILKGIGDTMGSLVLILVFGAVLGKLIEESGAAHTISYALTDLFGQQRIQISVLITGFIVGLPMIYNASFLVLIPLIYTLARTTRLPLMYLGIPLSSALSVTHGYLPPHPAPTSIAVLYRADVNQTLLYGLFLAVPATILAGPVLARFFSHLRNQPPPELYAGREFRREDLPSLRVSLFTTLVPVLLMLLGAVVSLLNPNGGTATAAAAFLSDPTIALFLAVATGIWTLGIARGRTMDDLMRSVTAGVASVSMVILIIASGGAFKQVLLDGGTGEAIKILAEGVQLSPILLAWATAALVRMALGSATVAAITAAGIVLPLIPESGVRPEFLVIATTAGSLMFSHFNDIGFWMFKEYYNVTVKQTFQIWTVMESIVAVVGLAGAFLLHAMFGAPPAAAASKTVFFVNSYHEGYPTSDAAMDAAIRKLRANGIRVEKIFLDGKRDTDSQSLRRKAAAIAASIRTRRPDAVIACDDDAAKYLIVPYLKQGPTPVVFCGVNSSAEPYGLPTAWVTGMIEVLPLEDALQEIRRVWPKARKLAVVSEDSTSEHSNTRLLDPKFRSLGFEPSYSLVSTFSNWKVAFTAAQAEADVIYLPTNGAVRNWDHKTAVEWVSRHLRKPVFTCDDFMVPYALFGITKIAREQGEWAADTVIRILHGAKPADIPVTANRQSECFLNSANAARLNWSPTPGRACKPI